VLGDEVEVLLEAGRERGLWFGVTGCGDGNVLHGQGDELGTRPGEFVLETSEEQPGVRLGEARGLGVLAEGQADFVQVLGVHPNLQSVTDPRDLGHVYAAGSGQVRACNPGPRLLNQFVNGKCDMAHAKQDCDFCIFLQVVFFVII